MNLPYFYIPPQASETRQIILSETTSKHIVQVLRMKLNEKIKLTDGEGNIYTCIITDDNRKRSIVQVQEHQFVQRPTPLTCIAISPLKNNTRFEWFIEKATEAGISQIIPLHCDRSEKVSLKTDRLQQIIISAMLQSQQCWLPVLHAVTSFKRALASSEMPQKYIAHCIEGEPKKSLSQISITSVSGAIVCIGPEGDFTNDEIALAKALGYEAVSLGNTRLRTETAGLYAAVVLNSLTNQ